MERIRKALDLARAERDRRVPADVQVCADAANAMLDVETATTPAGTTRPAARFAPDVATLERNRVVRQNSTSSAAEAFRLLRTQLLARMAERDWRSLAVVAPAAGEDRAGVAVNLAAAIAADPRHHAMVVDLDLRAPRVGALFGLTPAIGVEQVLLGQAAIEEALHRPDGFDRLALLPARTALPRASELLAGRATRDLVDELKARYRDRHVVYSVAPVLASDDALAFLPSVDCALVVVTEGVTRRTDLTRTMELLNRVPIVGTVLGDALAAGRSTE